jgi:hypothetical protein
MYKMSSSTLKERICRYYTLRKFVFENGHWDFVLSTQTFVLDYLKNTLIDTNLCGIFAFVLKIQKFHTNLCRLMYFLNYPTQKFVFWQHKIPVTVFKHKVCVAATQTLLECKKYISKINTF